MEIFPLHLPMDIWVTAYNDLGEVESEHLRGDADLFGKLQTFDCDRKVACAVLLSQFLRGVRLKHIHISTISAVRILLKLNSNMLMHN